jgi:hypothetical protein
MHPVVRAILQSGGINYAMRIATSTTGTDLCYYDSSGTIISGKTVVAEGTCKIETSGSSGCQGIVVGNGTKYATMLITGTSVICNYGGTSPFTHSMTTTADTIYKVKFNGTTNVEFYVSTNGVDYTLIHTATYANIVSAAFGKVEFGDGFSAANVGGSGIWKSFRYNMDYVADPTNFVVWDPASLPSSQGWTAGGTALATIITV